MEIPITTDQNKSLGGKSQMTWKRYARKRLKKESEFDRVAFESAKKRKPNVGGSSQGSKCQCDVRFSSLEENEFYWHELVNTNPTSYHESFSLELQWVRGPSCNSRSDQYGQCS